MSRDPVTVLNQIDHSSVSRQPEMIAAEMRHTPLVPRLYRSYLCGPDHPAKLRIMRQLERRLFKKSSVPFPVTNGIWLYLDPLEATERRLLEGIDYEPMTLAFMRKNISPGQNVLLAGTSFGLHLVTAAKCVGPEGIVVGVEPVASSLERTRSNLILNQTGDNVRLVAGGLGANECIQPISEPPLDHRGWASMRIRSTDDRLVPYYVQLFTVTSVCRQFSISRLDLMLLDVEGFEPYVLEAVEAASKPRILIVEIHPLVHELTGVPGSATYDILEALGYTCRTLRGERPKGDGDIPENNLVAFDQAAIEPCWV